MGVANFTNSNNGGANGAPSPNPPFMGGSSSFDPNDWMTNLNKKKNSPTLFRDAVINQTVSVLIGESKPNALLIGQAGVGKTKIAEELAMRIENKSPLIPQMLQGFTIWALQLSDLMAGSGIVGELESRVNDIVDFLANKNNKAIVFIDEIHLLFSGQEYKKIAQILKPAMSRGKIKVIGATTTQESSHFDTDPAFNRRFTKVIVDELSKEQTVEVLTHYVAALRTHYGIPFNFNVDLAKNVVDIADTFCNAGSHRPDNALTLLDRTIADAVVKKQEMLNDSDPNVVAMAKAMSGVLISENSLQKTAVKITTGNNEPKEFNEAELRNDLSVIKGQDKILDEIIKIIKLHEMHIRPRKTPITMLFAGASGVGKTEVTKIIGNSYVGEKPIILNMCEYHSSASINRIIGAPAGYVGYDNDSELPFDKLDTNPYQIILLDEFEKANKSVQRLFMSVFDEGTLTTNKGKVIDFSKAIVIVTTNAGCTNDMSRPLGLTSASVSSVTPDKTIQELSDYFDIELLNRFNHRFTFNAITKEIFTEILRDTYEKEVAQIKSNKPRIAIPDTLSDEDTKKLVNDTFEPTLGARPIKVAVNKYIDELILNLP